MRGEHRFRRVRGGRIAYANVGVSSQPDAVWRIQWAPELEFYRHNELGAAMEAGVRLAARAHEARGGRLQCVKLVSFGFMPADTLPDAVECAAALASWQAWGHPETDARVDFLEEKWKVVFLPGIDDQNPSP